MKSILLSVVLFFAVATATEDCNVVPMTQWAGEASQRKEALANSVNMVVIQHTVTPEGNSDEKCVRILNSIRKYHMETLGFDDIAESFFICGNGKIYEGAGWGLVGAHTKGYNKKTIGLSFVGEYGSHVPNSGALSAAQALLACAVENNHLNSEYRLVGHRQLVSTVSPGDALQEEIESWPHWTNNP